MKTAVEQRQSVDSSGEIVKMTQYAPWKEHLHDLERDLSISPPIKYVLYEVLLTPAGAHRACQGTNVLEEPIAIYWSNVKVIRFVGTNAWRHILLK